jgi:hypothetical protein
MEKRAMTIIFRAGVVLTVFALSAIVTNAQTLQNGGFELPGGLYTNAANPAAVTTGAVSWVQFANGLRTSTNDSGFASAHSGSYSLKCFGSTTWDGEGADQICYSNNVSVGQVWVLSGFGLNPSSDPMTNSSPLGGAQPFGDLILQFHNAAGAQISGSEVHIVNTLSLTGIWQSVSTTGTVPVGTAYIQVYVMELGFGAAAFQSGSVYFDDINLVNLNAPIVTNTYHEAIISGNQVCWLTTTNASYQAQFSFNNVTWVNVGSPIPGDGTSNCTFDASGSFGGRFYRVLELK